MSRKNLILFVLIIIPVSVFLFLNHFGKNHYNIPVYYPKDSIQVAGKWKHTAYHQIPAFSLIDQYGNTLNNKNIKGKITVSDFFFTRCGNPTLCPRMSSQLGRVQEHFSNEENLKILSFSVDPQYDSPEVLLKYAKKYAAQKGKWHLLTGNKKAIYQLATFGYFVTAGEEKASITPDFIHTTKLILTDTEGRIRGYYDGTDSEEVDRLILEIQILLYEKSNKK